MEALKIKLCETMPTLSNSLEAEKLSPDWEGLGEDWRFDIDSYVDQFLALDLESWDPQELLPSGEFYQKNKSPKKGAPMAA